MIYILVPVHNRIEETTKFIDSIKQQTFKDYTIVIVDDGSTDQTEQILKNKYPEVDIVKGDGNLWWTGSVNKGVEYIKSIAQSNDFILCANNDHIPEPNALEKVHQASLKYHRAITAAVIKTTTNDYVNAAFIINWRSYHYDPIPLAETGEYTNEIDVLPCRFTLIPLEVFNKVNFDYKRFPQYMGDYDFFLQCKYAGFKMIVSYDAIVYDKGGRSGIDKVDETMTLKEFINYCFDIRSHRNIFVTSKYLLKNCPVWYLKIALTLSLWIKYLIKGVKALFTSKTSQ